MNVLQAWFTNSWKLDPATAARATRAALWLSVVIIITAVLGVAAFAMQWADPQGLLWELVVKSRMHLFKGFGDIGRSLVVLLISIVEWWVLETSPMGTRWMAYHQDPQTGEFTEPPEVRATKKRNGVTVFCALLIANALIFMVGL